jgi:uncharacterized damage-inducible protein DinB
METNEAVANHYLETVLTTFQKQKALAEKAFAQLEPKHFHITLEAESNSVAVIMKHMAGNMRSRWTDFLTSDGEKSGRDRDQEFSSGENLPELMQRWEESWQILFTALESLTPDDVLKTVMIRAQPHTVMQAVERQIDHYAYHVGQIVFLAKHLQAEKWQTFSAARGGTKAFNKKMFAEGKLKAEG